MNEAQSLSTIKPASRRSDSAGVRRTITDPTPALQSPGPPPRSIRGLLLNDWVTSAAGAAPPEGFEAVAAAHMPRALRLLAAREPARALAELQVGTLGGRGRRSQSGTVTALMPYGIAARPSTSRWVGGASLSAVAAPESMVAPTQVVAGGGMWWRVNHSLLLPCLGSEKPT